MLELGQMIRTARLTQRLSQDDLSAATGIARPTLSRLENGKLPELGITKVMALCARLGLALTLEKAHGRPTLQQLTAERTTTTAPYADLPQRIRAHRSAAEKLTGRKR